MIVAADEKYREDTVPALRKAVQLLLKRVDSLEKQVAELQAQFSRVLDKKAHNDPLKVRKKFKQMVNHLSQEQNLCRLEKQFFKYEVPESTWQKCCQNYCYPKSRKVAGGK